VLVTIVAETVVVDSEIFLPLSNAEEELKILLLPSFGVLSQVMAGRGRASTEQFRTRGAGLKILTVPNGDSEITGATKKINNNFKLKLYIFTVPIYVILNLST